MHIKVSFCIHILSSDLKSCNTRVRVPSPASARRPGGGAGAGEPHLVGGYHWDCSDWCGGGGALPGISEVAGSERPDSSSPPSPPSPRSPRPPRLSPRRTLPLAFDTDSATDDHDHDPLRFTDGQYLLNINTIRLERQNLKNFSSLQHRHIFSMLKSTLLPATTARYVPASSVSPTRIASSRCSVSVFY